MIFIKVSKNSGQSYNWSTIVNYNARVDTGELLKNDSKVAIYNCRALKGYPLILSWRK